MVRPNRMFERCREPVPRFHNNPLEMKLAKSAKERIDLYNKTKKIIFNSNWTLNQFTKGLNKKYITKKLEVINQSTSKKIINFKNKKKIILFVGRLNISKGYDIFGEAIINILNNYPDWNAVVIGDEPREKHFFKHRNLKILGFQKHNSVLKILEKSSIAVVCSRWNEPFGRTSLEAASRGCAVIISDRGGLKETITDGIIVNKVDSKNFQRNTKRKLK